MPKLILIMLDEEANVSSQQKISFVGNADNPQVVGSYARQLGFELVRCNRRSRELHRQRLFERNVTWTEGTE